MGREKRGGEGGGWYLYLCLLDISPVFPGKERDLSLAFPFWVSPLPTSSRLLTGLSAASFLGHPTFANLAPMPPQSAWESAEMAEAQKQIDEAEESEEAWGGPSAEWDTG